MTRRVITSECRFARSASEAEYPQLWPTAGWSIPLTGRGGVLWRSLGTYQSVGTLTNMVPASDYITAGGVSCLDFDGVGDVVIASLSNVPRFAACTEATWCGWVRPTTTVAYSILLQFTTGLGIYVSANATDMTSSWENTADEYNRVTGMTLQTGQWNFLASAHSVRRGVIERTISNPNLHWKTDTQSKTLTSKNLNTTWYFGRNTTDANQLVGQIADVLFYDRFLTVGQLKQLANLGPGGWATPAVRPRRYRAEEAAAPAENNAAWWLAYQMGM